MPTPLVLQAKTLIRKSVQIPDIASQRSAVGTWAGDGLTEIKYEVQECVACAKAVSGIHPGGLRDSNSLPTRSHDSLPGPLTR